MIAYNSQIPPAFDYRAFRKPDVFTLSRLRSMYILVFLFLLTSWDQYFPSYATPGFLAGFVYVFFSLTTIRFSYSAKGMLDFIIPFLLLLGLLFIMTTINMSPKNRNAYSEARQFLLSFMVFYALVNEIRHRPELTNVLLKIYILSFTVFGILGLLGLGAINTGGRLRLYNINPNGLSLFYVMAFLSVLKIIFEEKIGRFYLIFLIISIFVYTIIIIRTGSRGGAISLGLGLMFYLYFFNLPARLKVPFSIFGGILFTVLMVMILNSDLIQSRFAEEEERGDLGHRLGIWELAWPLIEKNPLFGNGASGLELYMMGFKGRFKPVHSTYITLLVYVGIVGLLIFLWILYKLWIGSRYLNKSVSSAFFIVVFITFFVNHFIAGGTVLTSFVLWFFMALTYGNYLYFKNK